MLSVLSPQSAINIQLAPNSLAAPAYLMPFIFHHKANSHFLINAVAFLWTLFICTFFFSCPEMPEGSSYLAQNSTDLSAAISPGSLYLISFCKSLSHLLLEFCFPGFSHRLLLIVFFFPQRIWFPLLFLVWTLPGCFFLPGNQQYATWGIWEMWKVIFWWFPFCRGAYLRPGR